VRKFAATNERNRESGYGLVFAAFGLVVLLGAAGLSVDMGYLRYQRRLLQSATDSAALAGAAQLGAGGGTLAAQNAAAADSELNGFKDGGTISVTANKITLNGNANTMQVTVADIYPTFFMRIFGGSFRNVTVSTIATAQYLGSRGCIYALTGGGGITLGGGATVNVPNCNVFSNQGISGGGSILAAAIGSHNGSSVTATPPVITGMVRTSDPLANIAAPGIPGGACINKNITANINPGGQPPISPGKYCSISIAAAVSQPITFLPGTYVITGNGGAGLSFRGSGTLTGAGVTFYITGGSVQTNASQHLNFTAPNNGILFFQRNTNTANATIAATGNSKLQGALYFPNATLNLNGGANGASSGSDYMLLVAHTLNLNTNVNFPSNYRSLLNATSPIRTSVLVQ
jgi:Putative Flp pilus-assembly TadE/G-like